MHVQCKNKFNHLDNHFDAWIIMISPKINILDSCLDFFILILQILLLYKVEIYTYFWSILKRLQQSGADPGILVRGGGGWIVFFLEGMESGGRLKAVGPGQRPGGGCPAVPEF